MSAFIRSTYTELYKDGKVLVSGIHPGVFLPAFLRPFKVIFKTDANEQTIAGLAANKVRVWRHLRL